MQTNNNDVKFHSVAYIRLSAVSCVLSMYIKFGLKRYALSGNEGYSTLPMWHGFTGTRY